MDSFLKKIDTAIASRDFMALASVLSSSSNGGTTNSGWNSIGGGEQRSVAAYLVKMLVSNAATLIPGVFQCYPCLRTVESILLGNNCLPTSPLENAADNKLRKLLFDYYLQQLDFMGAAKILSSTRICDDDPKSVYYLSPADRCDCECGCCYSTEYSTRIPPLTLVCSSPPHPTFFGLFSPLVFSINKKT